MNAMTFLRVQIPSIPDFSMVKARKGKAVYFFKGEGNFIMKDAGGGLLIFRNGQHVLAMIPAECGREVKVTNVTYNRPAPEVMSASDALTMLQNVMKPFRS